MPRGVAVGSLVAAAMLSACGAEGERSATTAVSAAAATAPAGAFKGKIYAAGVGGHMAVVNLSIDPSNMANPLTVSRLERIRLGDAQSYGFHDVRIDRTRGRAGKLFWSTINADPSGGYRYGRTSPS